MQLTIKNGQEEFRSNAQGRSISFSLSTNSPALYDVLRNRLYSNIPRTLVQEILANGRDACRALPGYRGPEDDRIDVKLPTALSPILSFRDYGIGLSPEMVANVFVVFGESTKRVESEGAEKFNGSFGLGGKIPFAYADSFTITSWYGGMKTVYVASLGRSAAGSLDVISEEPSAEPTGVEVAIAIAPKDFQVFTRAYYRAVLLWEVKPTVTQIEVDTKLAIERLAYEKMLSLPKSSIYGQEISYGRHAGEQVHPAVVGLGGVAFDIDGIPYPVPANFTSHLDGHYDWVYKKLDSAANSARYNQGRMTTLFVKLRQIEADVAASREAFTNAEAAARAFKEAIDEIALVVAERIVKAERAGRIQEELRDMQKNGLSTFLSNVRWGETDSLFTYDSDLKISPKGGFFAVFKDRNTRNSGLPRYQISYHGSLFAADVCKDGIYGSSEIIELTDRESGAALYDGMPVKRFSPFKGKAAESKAAMIKFLRSEDKKSLIFICTTSGGVENLQEAAKRLGFSGTVFHAPLEKITRTVNMEAVALYEVEGSDVTVAEKVPSGEIKQKTVVVAGNDERKALKDYLEALAELGESFRTPEFFKDLLTEVAFVRASGKKAMAALSEGRTLVALSDFVGKEHLHISKELHCRITARYSLILTATWFHSYNSGLAKIVYSYARATPEVQASASSLLDIKSFKYLVDLFETARMRLLPHSRILYNECLSGFNSLAKETDEATTEIKTLSKLLPLISPACTSGDFDTSGLRDAAIYVKSKLEVVRAEEEKKRSALEGKNSSKNSLAM